MNIKDTLFRLSSACSTAYLTEASDIAYEILSQYTDDCIRRDDLSVVGTIKGESERTLMLDAHIDEVAFIVTDIDSNGFLTVSKCGGTDIRMLPARSVTVHGKKDIPAVFCSTPPHLASGSVEYDDISKIKLDTMLGSNATDIVSKGDIVTFNTSPSELIGTKVTGKSFDDRAGVVCLLEVARRLCGKSLPMNVVFLLSDSEELGLRGCKTATFAADPDEAIAIDVSFGDGPGISQDECGALSGGAMIGYSPVLDSAISRRLQAIAEQNSIKHQIEVMGGRTGTNGDAISVNREGVRTGLISIPLRNMHTDTEVVDLDDIISVCDLLEKYILSGGAQYD